MLKESILSAILQYKLIAIVRGVSSDAILDTAKALAEGGIRCMEVTFPAANGAASLETLRSISLVKERFSDEFYIGAGTVLSVEQVNEAAIAGAEFMISPSFHPAVIERTKTLGKISLPGAYTPTEIQNAYMAGADIVKVFPSHCLGAAYFKAIKAPLSNIRLAAVGGVDEHNIGDFLAAGVDAFGIGGNLVNVKAVNEGDWQGICRAAQKFVVAVERARRI